MIAEVIEQMRKELYDTHFCISDFEKYDLKELENTNEPFFWLVRDGGTSLCFIGPSMENLFFIREHSVCCYERTTRKHIEYCLLARLQCQQVFLLGWDTSSKSIQI